MTAGIPARRTQISSELVRHCSNASLALARFMESAGDENRSKREILKLAASSVSKTGQLYGLAYDRWFQDTSTSPNRIVQAKGRLVIGLGNESALETGLTLHPVYGVPFLPAQAIKGLAAHYCDRVWAVENPRFRCGQDYYTILFGRKEDAGHVSFHDGWLLPESLGHCLIEDVMTPHHSEYLMAGSDPNLPAPTDFDAPNPVSFLCVRGRFRLVAQCPSSDGRNWAELALDLVCHALQDWGLGAKTSSGYGRLEKV